MENKIKNQNRILWIITVILIINTVTILFVYIDTRNKYNKLNLSVMQMAAQMAEPAEIKDLDPGVVEYQYLGKDTAPVELIIITDFECPYCKKMTDQIFPSILEDFVKPGILRIGYLPFPLSKHPNALPAATAADYINENYEFWPFFHYLSENSRNLSPDVILDYAEKIGIDSDELKKAFSDEARIQKIIDTRSELAAKGINGTPSIVINGKLYPGFENYQKLSEAIRTELSNTVSQITIEEGREILATGNAVFLDVRTGKEFAEGHITGALNSDVMKEDAFRRFIQKLDKDRLYVVYCKSGKRSASAAGIMVSEEFNLVKNMSSGYDGWSSFF